MNRTVVIGDLHGCYRELCQLLKKINYNPDKDKLIFTGDIINRGPNSKKCIKFMQDYGAKSVLGNHEWFLLKSLKDREYDRNVYKKMHAEFGADFDNLIEIIQKWPSFITLQDCLIVHAGINVNIPPAETDPEYLVTVREIEDSSGDKIPWFKHYAGKDTIIFGHWAKLGGIIRKNVIGLDLGCVYGGRLRCIILPSREIVEVPAAKVYFK